MVKSNNNQPETDLNEERPLEIISRREALGFLDDLVEHHSLDVFSEPNELNLLKYLNRILY
jgi:hypothetical protein